MQKNIKSILKRALKNGFDLSSIENYNPKLFMNKLYTYLVEKKYFCFEEEDYVIVSDYLLEDLAEIFIDGYHLRITPSKTEGMFELLIEVFRFIADNPNLKTEDDETTEKEEIEESEDSDSKEFDWI